MAIPTKEKYSFQSVPKALTVLSLLVLYNFSIVYLHTEYLLQHSKKCMKTRIFGINLLRFYLYYGKIN